MKLVIFILNIIYITSLLRRQEEDWINSNREKGYILKDFIMINHIQRPKTTKEFKTTLLPLRNDLKLKVYFPDKTKNIHGIGKEGLVFRYNKEVAFGTNFYEHSKEQGIYFIDFLDFSNLKLDIKDKTISGYFYKGVEFHQFKMIFSQITPKDLEDFYKTLIKNLHEIQPILQKQKVDYEKTCKDLFSALAKLEETYGLDYSDVLLNEENLKKQFVNSYPALQDYTDSYASSFLKWTGITQEDKEKEKTKNGLIKKGFKQVKLLVKRIADLILHLKNDFLIKRYMTSLQLMRLMDMEKRIIEKTFDMDEFEERINETFSIKLPY